MTSLWFVVVARYLYYVSREEINASNDSKEILQPAESLEIACAGMSQCSFAFITKVISFVSVIAFTLLTLDILGDKNKFVLAVTIILVCFCICLPSFIYYSLKYVSSGSYQIKKEEDMVLEMTFKTLQK